MIVGLAIFYFKAKAVTAVVDINTGLFKSEVLFTFPNPTFACGVDKFETVAFVKSIVNLDEKVVAPCSPF